VAGDERQRGRRVAAAHPRVRPRSVRGAARGGPRALRRGTAAGAGLPALQLVGAARPLEPCRVSAGHAAAAVRAVAARMAGAARLRGGRCTALPVPQSLEPWSGAWREHRAHVAARTDLPAARWRLPAQGAQARLHPDADPRAFPREVRGNRRPRQAHHALAGVSASAEPIEIYTDGACRGNPGPGGWAALLRSGAHEKELSGADT